MKSIISKLAVLVFTIATLFAFTAKPGGEAFEIYLNNKLVLQRYGSKMNDIKSIRLNQSSVNDKITVKYNHCGKVSTFRHITIKNNQNKVIKVYKYADATSPMSGMEIQVKDLLNLKNANGNTLKLYYSSSELINGRILVNLFVPDISK